MYNAGTLSETEMYYLDLGTPNPVEWMYGFVRLLDQTRLPLEEVFLDLKTPLEVAIAIREMRVRGAPAIGVTAAYGMVLAAATSDRGDLESTLGILRTAHRELGSARPTAVNLEWALGRMIRTAENVSDEEDMEVSLLAEALMIHKETRESDIKMSEFGAHLIKSGSSVLTHCNTGSLATGGYGTALGMIRRAWEDGNVKEVFATETRPWFQGSRLTVWELAHIGIPTTLIIDSAAGYLMSRGNVHCVIVGADRIAANGDVANKIGTCSLAMLAQENKIPFYVVAPFSTVDMDIISGYDIPIEERPPEEVTNIKGVQIAIDGTTVLNLAFDVTPNRYIDAIITDRGVVRMPYRDTIKALMDHG